MEYDIEQIGKMTPYAAITYIRKGIGYEEYLKEYADSRRIKIEDLLEKQPNHVDYILEMYFIDLILVLKKCKIVLGGNYEEK